MFNFKTSFGRNNCVDLSRVLEVVLSVRGFLAFFVKVVDNMGQILTCWIFAYSNNNKRATLMYFIGAPAPLFP